MNLHKHGGRTVVCMAILIGIAIALSFAGRLP